MDDFSQGADALEAEDYQTACACFERVLEQTPQDADAWHNLGLAWFYRHEYTQALNSWRQARIYTREPDSLDETLFEAAHSLVHELMRNAEALAIYEQLLDSPRFGRKAHLFAVWCLLGNNRPADAARLAEQALKRYPDDLAFWLQNTFLLPQVYHRPEDFQFWRRRLLAGLDAFEAWVASAPVIEMTDVLTYSPIFSLMPMGFDEVDTFRRISRLWRRLFVEAGQEQLARQPEKGPKLRLGLISAAVWNHSTMHYFRGMLELLAQEDDIEVAMFDFGARSDGMTDYVKSLTNDYFRLERHLDAAVSAISAWQPEILMYLDIGQETLLYTLAHHRLAPVQCVTAGVPITTGIDTMDYYFSSRCFESEEAPHYYSEELICLDDLMVCMRPPEMPEMPAMRQSREAFGISDTAHVYFFPHTLIRVDPELDDILAEILRRDPAAHIYFMRLLNTDLHEHIQSRFEARFPELGARLHFLPWLSQPEFLTLLTLADVALDGLRLAGGNVSFQCFWTGTPIVTCPTPFLRGRIATGLYGLINRSDAVARDWNDYLEKALKLGTDREYRAELSAAMLKGREQIFNRPEGMQEIFACFRRWTGR